jgi:DNA-binding CsgD family transcriptional regulator/tetratricopeptide (TPR) repeat protein
VTAPATTATVDADDADPPLDTTTQDLETHALMSDHSDIIRGVGLDGSAAGVFVGRDDDAARLGELLGLGTDSESGMVLLSGDAGIGKTRLLAEVGHRARAEGWTVLVGHCLGEAGQSMPYLPFSEMLTRLEADDPSSVERTMSAHSALAALFPSRRRSSSGPQREAPDTLDPRDLVEAAHAAFEGISWSAPVLLVVEDVHWADQSSRDLLTLFFTRGFGGRVSIVASYRSDDLHRRHPLRSTLAHWSRLADVRRLDLEPLSDSAVRDLVRGVQPRPLTEHEVRTVVDRAEGNAFFAEELVAASVLGQNAIAEDLSRLLLVRFDQLEPAGQHVVRMAAAAGRHVSHALLAAVAGLGDAELDQGLREAVEHHILVPTDRGGYAFRHALLAETVYDDLLPGERVRAHERYAAALSSDPSLGTWADVARHADAAGDREAALDASIHAGDSAMSVGGPEEAWRHYRRALALIPDHHPDADRLVLRASAALTAKGHAIKGLALLEERLSRREVDDDPVGRAELLASLATTARLTESTIDTLAATKEGLGLLEALEESRQTAQVRARLLGARVQALVDRGRDEEAVRAAQEAVDAALAAGLPEVADEVRVVEARVLERGGDPKSSQATLEQIIAAGNSSGDPAQVRALHHLGSLHHRLGHLDQAVDVYRRGAEAGAAAGRAWAPYAFDSRLLAGVAAYEVGRWDEALDILDVSGEDAPQPGEALLRGARLYVVAGRGGTNFVDELAAIRPWWEDEGLIAVLGGGAAIDLHGHAGDVTAALAAHDEAVEVLTRIWHRHFQAQTRLSALLLGQLASFVQRVPTSERGYLLARGRDAADDAEQVWARVSEVPGQHGPEAQAWIARARAEGLRLRWLGGEEVEPGELVDRWRNAVGGFDVYGHRYEAARSRARLGAALQAAGDPAASEVLQAALATAHALGAEPLLAEIRSAGGRTQASGRPTDRLGEALTPREEEILALVALGRSNRQIGTQLFISAKTASVHVSNIIAKLGVSGRGEAVAVARERGLLG